MRNLYSLHTNKTTAPPSPPVKPGLCALNLGTATKKSMDTESQTLKSIQWQRRSLRPWLRLAVVVELAAGATSDVIPKRKWPSATFLCCGERDKGTRRTHWPSIALHIASIHHLSSHILLYPSCHLLKSPRRFLPAKLSSRGVAPSNDSPLGYLSPQYQLARVQRYVSMPSDEHRTHLCARVQHRNRQPVENSIKIARCASRPSRTT